MGRYRTLKFMIKLPEDITEKAIHRDVPHHKHILENCLGVLGEPITGRSNISGTPCLRECQGKSCHGEVLHVAGLHALEELTEKIN